jgi:hypothetical protein
MKNTKKIDLLDTPFAIGVLIFGRFLLASALGMLPIIIGLKDDWYVTPLVILGLIFQFGLAIIQMLPYLKKISTYINS